MVFFVWHQNHSLGFSILGLKTSSFGLVIWPTKSLRRYLGLGLKTKWAMVCQLCLKIDGRMKWHGTHIGSSSLLRLEVGQARVSHSSLKTGGGAALMVAWR
jgi:hypothetical protein